MSELKHDMLEAKYRNKVVCYDDKGESIYGKIDEITVEAAFGHPVVIIIMNSQRYECDYEYLDEHIRILG